MSGLDFLSEPWWNREEIQQKQPPLLAILEALILGSGREQWSRGRLETGVTSATAAHQPAAAPPDRRNSLFIHLIERKRLFHRCLNRNLTQGEKLNRPNPIFDHRFRVSEGRGPHGEEQWRRQPLTPILSVSPSSFFSESRKKPDAVDHQQRAVALIHSPAILRRRGVDIHKA